MLARKNYCIFVVVIVTKEDLRPSSWEGNGSNCSLRAWPKT